MIFGTNPSWIADLAAKPDSPVQRITIRPASTIPMALELRDAGVTESVIFPDLDGLGRELKQALEQRYYE